jgi:hypothetical protein
VVRETFLIDGAAPGQALCALDLLMDAVDHDLRRGRDEDEETPVRNLADLPTHGELEGFISRACRQIVRINRSRAELLVIAVRLLTRFLVRHELIDAGVAPRAEVDINRLTGLLSHRGRDSDKIPDDFSRGDS